MPPLPYRIIDTTLREGEQFERANFSTADKLEIAEALAEFGVDYIEVTSPMASPRSRQDCTVLADRPLGATRVLTHIRCQIGDAEVAVDTGVHGVNMVIGVSAVLRRCSHGMEIDEIIDHALGVIDYIRGQAPDTEIRFSTEDTFRAPAEDWLRIYRALDATRQVDRFGVADTTGGGDPFSVYDAVRRMRAIVDADIEFHGHNDTDCAVANAYAAVRAGATHIDTSVLGLGERNGITSLEGFVARMYADDPADTRARFRLDQLPRLCRMLASKVDVSVPFNQAVVGAYAFTHKAGIHTNAVLKDPKSYEVLDPEDFGRDRTLSISHKLTGSNAIRVRAHDLGLDLSADQIRTVTETIKALADTRPVTIEEVDAALVVAQGGPGPGA